MFWHGALTIIGVNNHLQFLYRSIAWCSLLAKVSEVLNVFLFQLLVFTACYGRLLLNVVSPPLFS